MTKIEHENILKYKDFYMNDDYICLVTDWMHMNLMEYLNDCYNHLSRKIKLSIFKKIAEAVDNCHQQSIMHRDIKLENVLVNVDGQANVTHVRLADFGLACSHSRLASEDHLCGTLSKMPPEMLVVGASYD